jgi:hypothetical protein
MLAQLSTDLNIFSFTWDACLHIDCNYLTRTFVENSHSDDKIRFFG